MGLFFCHAGTVTCNCDVGLSYYVRQIEQCNWKIWNFLKCKVFDFSAIHVQDMALFCHVGIRTYK